MPLDPQFWDEPPPAPLDWRKVTVAEMDAIYRLWQMGLLPGIDSALDSLRVPPEFMGMKNGDAA